MTWLNTFGTKQKYINNAVGNIKTTTRQKRITTSYTTQEAEKQQMGTQKKNVEKCLEKKRKRFEDNAL